MRALLPLLWLPGSSAIEAILQLLWTPAIPGAAAMVSFYWDWFACQHVLLQAAIVSALVSAVFVLMFIPRWLIYTRHGRSKARQIILDAQDSIKNWANPIYLGLQLDIKHDRNVTDYGDDQTSILTAKNTIDRYDTQWGMGVNKLVGVLNAGYEKYVDARTRFQECEKSDKDAVRNLREEMKQGIGYVIYGCNNIIAKLKR